MDRFVTNVYPTASGTIGGWQGEAISFAIGFAAGLLIVALGAALMPLGKKQA